MRISARSQLEEYLRKAYAGLGPVTRERVRVLRHLGYLPNFRTPQRFTEKCSYRKLFDRDPRYAELSDKLRVREYVASLVGSEYLPRLIHIADTVEELLHQHFPNRFVIKPTHDAGSTEVIRDAERADWSAISRRLETAMQSPFGVSSGEWWYSQIAPRLLVEEYIQDGAYDSPLDYKLFVFHGSVRVVQVIQDRDSVPKQRLYSPEWEPLPVSRVGWQDAPVATRPLLLGEMIEVAESLGSGFDFVRVDLYSPNHEGVLFGEMTFCPRGGLLRFSPESFDMELGRYW